MQIRHFRLSLFVFLVSQFAHADVPQNAELDQYRQWALGMITEWAPPGRSYIPEAKETEEETRIRYKSIVDDAVSVAFDPKEKPLFVGPYGRSQTLTLMLSTAWWESGYRKDIDLNLGSKSRGDHGRSWCLMQIQLGNPRNAALDTPTHIRIDTDAFRFVRGSGDTGLSGGDLIRDRRSCFRAGLHVMRGAFQWCSKLPLADRLSGGYTSNRCIPGQRESRNRVEKAIRWFRKTVVPVSDDRILSAFSMTASLPVRGLSTTASSVGQRLIPTSLQEKFDDH